MPRFCANDRERIKDYLYNCCSIHDAELESFVFLNADDCITVKAYNPFYDNEIDLAFSHIGSIVSIRENEVGSHKTISCLVLLEDLDYLNNRGQVHMDYRDDLLYFLFEMFSGDIILVACSEMYVSLRKKAKTG